MSMLVKITRDLNQVAATVEEHRPSQGVARLALVQFGMYMAAQFDAL